MGYLSHRDFQYFTFCVLTANQNCTANAKDHSLSVSWEKQQSKHLSWREGGIGTQGGQASTRNSAGLCRCQNLYQISLKSRASCCFSQQKHSSGNWFWLFSGFGFFFLAVAVLGLHLNYNFFG